MKLTTDLSMTRAQRRHGRAVGPLPEAEGGIETVMEQGGKFWRVHTYLESGLLDVKRAGDVEYLAVAGGEKGGDNGGGGGGAGGYRKFVAGEAHNTASAPLALSVGEIQITVGDAAENTSIGALLEALAGGRGGDHFGAGGDPAQPGGCGGGGGGGTGSAESNGLLAGASGSQGGDGGDGYSNNADASRRAGGGGGGGTGNGQNGSDSAGGLGGAGIVTEISGTEQGYCRGGDGRARNQTAVTVPAAPNTGDGGPGQNSSAAGLAGGSGIVIIRYEITEAEYLEAA